MSWAEEDWTVGMPGRALQKLKELQVQQERLNRERQQKQLQLDSTQTSLNKQTVKYEEVRGELQCVQRELQVAREEVQAGVCVRERLSQDLQVKQAQVCSLEGQLGSARTLTHTLEKEVKRLEADLEKLQNTSSSGESMLFSTPCWSMTSPRDHNGRRQEERQGYRGERDNKAQHVRLKFSDPGVSPTPMFPQQQAKGPPHRRPSHQSDSSTPSAVFPWERDDPKPSTRGRLAPPPSPPLPSSNVIRRGQDAGGCGMVEDLRRETDMSGCVAELQGRMHGLQGEMKAECERFRQSQDALANARRNLTTREQSLQRAKDELSLAYTRISQESDRAQSLEQRVKQLQEELKCQRQNAESSRLQHQQRTRDLDKQHQRDLLDLQKECQSAEKRHQLDVNKLNQEVQQTRILHNTLQAQSEKVTLQKQALERDIDALKEKVKWTEGELKESQKKEAQTQTKLTESLCEREGLNVTLEQNRRRERGLEEEVKKLAEELAEALRRIKELEDQKTVQPIAAPMAPVPFSPAGQSFSPVSQIRHGHTTPSAQTNRPARGEQAREERGNEGQRAKYPTEREPGEGIDSEHITPFGSTDSDKTKRAGERGKGEERKRENERQDEVESVVDGCIPGKDASTKDKTSLSTQSSLSDPDHSPHLSSSASSDTDYESETLSSHSKPRAQTTGAEGDLQRENQELRSELQDVKDELQRRLEDLETQRRAAAEARTRLKQHSHKPASQAETSREKEERRRELEERAETGRLKEALTELEIKVRRDGEDRERGEREKEERKERERGDRESESMLLNLQLKKKLAELKTELLREREERESEKEERKRLKNKGIEGTIDLTVKLEELQEELKELKNCGRLEVKNMVDKNTPLTYLTLHHDITSNSNNNTVVPDYKLLPSPDQHHLLCENTNPQNTVVSQATETTADLIQEDGTLTKAPDLSRPIGEGETIVEAQRGVSASELGETTVEAEKGVSPSDQAETTMELQSGGLSASELAQEVEHLCGESANEAGRARQTQAKLVARQSQVTRQTQQLTLAFDHQSRHIQELLGQGQELQRCRDELATLREEKGRREEERQKEEIKESRVTITPQQADHYTDVHQITQNESASGIEESTDITKPLNTTQASSALSDEGGQLPTPQKNCVTELYYVIDSTSTLSNHPVENEAAKMVDSKASAQPSRSEETVENTEKFKSDHLTVTRSEEQMGHPEGSGLQQQHVRSDGHAMDSPAFRRATEEFQLSQRDPSLTRTENTLLTVELEKASGPTNKQYTNGQGREESLAEELRSLKQQNEQLKLKLQDVATTDREMSFVSNTTLPATCEYQAERRAKRRKRKNQRGQEVISTSGELEQISDIITSGWEATLQDGGKPKDEERGEVESEGERERGARGDRSGGVERERGAGYETLLDTTPLAPFQITCLEKQVVALQAELQSLSEENQRQAEDLAVWRLMAQTPCLDPEDPIAATHSPAPLSPGHNTAPLSPGHNTAPLSPGHNTVTVIREDELLLSCTFNRLYGRTLVSRLQHCNSLEPKSIQNSPRKNKSTYHQETEKPTNEHRDEEADVTKDVYQTSELQTKATEHANQDDPENKTNPNTPRATDETQTKATEHANQDDPENKTNPNTPSATDETQTKEIVSRHNLDIIELNDLREFPTLSLAEAQSTEAQSSETNHPSHHQEEPISTGVENKNHCSVCRKVTTTTTGEWQTERTIVETKVQRLEVRSTSSQTEERGATGVWTPTQPSTPATSPETHQVYTQTEKEEDGENDEDEVPTESPPMSPVWMSEAEGDRMLFSGSFPIPADPARLAERIRRNRYQMSAAYDDTEYEPYGLPEVVMKGFADIPSGPACPYIVRRGLLGTDAMPLPQRDPGQRGGGRRTLSNPQQIHWETVRESPFHWTYCIPPPDLMY
ncbi:trichohyalin isoform X1 [Salmo salar]|uniref:Trichohyalin-like isoform X1 n=2 Tax=Salmo salar TaxID=8030 RepID=A0A1S3SVQ6_SALSA|nr:trichohyalin-like isoform X1 [Salmo salar]XP_014068426.2 trichohyalin-like isoform X1 [Salmo salar]